MEAVDFTEVEAALMAAVDSMGAEEVSTAVEDFTEAVASTVAAGFAAGAASEAAADFVAARSAEERDFAVGQDFAVERSAAAFAETASAAAGAGADAVGVGEDGAGAGAWAGVGRITGIGPDIIRTDMGTTQRGRRLITRRAMIPTTLTTTLHPLILAIRIEMIHTGTTGT